MVLPSDANASIFGAPAEIESLKEKAEEFRKSCLQKNGLSGAGDKILISDYSSTPPTMYVFVGGSLKTSFPVSWGNGGSGGEGASAPKACNEKSSKLTPPGFHLTVPHTGGAAYSEQNSLGLAGLNGQRSHENRGILIHAVEGSGQANTWGCSGLSMDDFYTIKNEIGYGALVYNHFGNQTDCDGKSLMPPDMTCQPEASARNQIASSSGDTPLLPAQSTSSDSPQRRNIRRPSNRGSNR